MADDKGGYRSDRPDDNPFRNLPPSDRPRGDDDRGQQGPPVYYNQPPPQNDGGGDNSAVWGWLIFFLIFGVGNLILYSTTGIFFIPIPRR